MDLDILDLRRLAVSLSQRIERLHQLAEAQLPRSDFDAQQNAQRAATREAYRDEARYTVLLWKRVENALYAAENGGETLFESEV